MVLLKTDANINTIALNIKAVFNMDKKDVDIVRWM